MSERYLLIPAVYSIAAVIVHHRFQYRGFWYLNAAIIAVLIVGGLAAWPSDFSDHAWLSARGVAACNGLGALPGPAVLMLGGWFALRIGDRYEHRVYARLGVFFAMTLLLALPALLVNLFWVVSVLGCDTV